MAASISISPDNCSALLPVSSDAVIDWSSAVTVPVAAVRVPVPPALPTPVTASPTVASSVERSAVCRPEASVSCRTATSSVGSVPTTVAV